MTFLAQSGSVFGAITDNNARIGLNFAVSCGRELSASVADYMDYALELESTRAIGLFLETVRDPEGFVAALAEGRAARRTRGRGQGRAHREGRRDGGQPFRRAGRQRHGP